MGATTFQHGSSAGNQSLQIILHQISFLLTGLCTTLGVQWLFYRKAASSMSLLPQLSTYTGMLLVGLFIPVLLKRKQRMALHYKMLTAEDDSDNQLFRDHLAPSADATTITTATTTVEGMMEIHRRRDIYEDDDLKLPVPNFAKEEGPIPHLSVIKLASLEILSSFALTIGFSIIGSGMYQVIYSSVVIWCAIFTWMFMGRALSRIQWVAIIGTSIGLGISSVDSFRGSPTLEADDLATADNSLLHGTLMTLGGTLISACIYVYADNILSKNDRQPLPARVCCWMGVYTSMFAWLWISVYTLPQWDTMIHIEVDGSKVVMMYIIITIANTLHSWNYYELIERTGNVATGILQGLRAILVYLISHVWYCQEDSAQCFTTPKGCGSVIVISCVLLFTLGKNNNK